VIYEARYNSPGMGGELARNNPLQRSKVCSTAIGKEMLI
jgi:hypothetical protein